jgi:hypothetical protein
LLPSLIPVLVIRMWLDCPDADAGRGMEPRRGDDGRGEAIERRLLMLMLADV